MVLLAVNFTVPPIVAGNPVSVPPAMESVPLLVRVVLVRLSVPLPMVTVPELFRIVTVMLKVDMSRPTPVSTVIALVIAARAV